MKREIKFRAWARTGEWDDDGEKRKFEMIPADSLMIFEDLLKDGLKDVDDEYYVMQFTGLHDKNGKEIFEGDVVDVYENTTANTTYAGLLLYPKCEVVFESGCFCLMVPTGNPSRTALPIYIEQVRPLEIIGNIYENPELLK